ncbi:erythroferrone [Gadus morhua]|uniref:erythroferrone n=1 Tax=Gadus morhua TaxID=8049 RepID=UPI0011B68E91|nr:erythroferrone-like [Gadus morhua]
MARPGNLRAAAAGLRAPLLPPTTVSRLLLLLLLVQSSAAETPAGWEDVIEDPLEDSEADGTLRPLTTLEALSPGGSRLTPQKSWLIFRRNSNKGDNRRTRPHKRPSKHGLPGPPGPPGPQGPPGPPPSPVIHNTEELQLKLRELASSVCVLCEQRPRVATSFHSRLQQPLSITRRSLYELLPFTTPSTSEQPLQRGPGFNSSTGRYSAPLAGFYQLTASLLIESSERGTTQRPRDSVKASICIDSLCQTNVSVESVMGVRSGGGVFSILLTGTLYLQAGEYVSVFVDNATGSAISVLTDSLFSGILLGV